MPLSYCAAENKPCLRWVQKYFKDCLCNLTDEISFVFGLVSLLCWGVAEIPQIITNFHSKSSHGVSLAFLLTWVAGDIFNLMGCLLEPATLPTQYYTALLYTTSTVVLVLQSVYYDYIYTWWKCGKITASEEEEEEKKKPLNPNKLGDSSIPIPRASPKPTPRREFYYTSARSLASSGTPPFRTYMRVARSGPSTMAVDSDSSSEDEAAPVTSKYSTTQPRPIPRSVAGYGTFLATSLNLPSQTKALTHIYIGITGRKLLQERHPMEHSAFGQWLGWLMAAIYMGGRLPQIWLNIKRGSVEGLNPLMFVFALVANVAYVGSILVRTIEWESIKANLPWLLDAAVCVLLDLFIILQYIYYKHLRKREGSEEYTYYKEGNKDAAS